MLFQQTLFVLRGKTQQPKIAEYRYQFNDEDCCGLRAEHLLSLSRATLQQLKKLWLFSYGEDGFGGKGGKYLLQGQWQKLESLSLCGSKMEVEGAKAIVAAELPYLKQLHLCKLYLTQMGAN